MLDRLAYAVARLGAKAPRGCSYVFRALAAISPAMRCYRFPTRYGPIYCDLSERVCWDLVKYGEYIHWRADEAELQKLPIDPEGIILDIGANIGVMSRIFAAMAREVHAFEPAPRALRLLKANTRDLPNVHIHRVALSDRAGTLRFAEKYALDMSRIDEEGDIEVSATTIDALGMTPTLIKIDVEDHEDQVLRGAMETLRAGPTIIFEALDASARQSSEGIIRGANPAYKFKSLGGHTNYVAYV